MVNGPGAIFTKRHSGAGGYHHEVFHDDEHVVRVLTKILDDASRSHRKLDPAEGLQDAQLDNGARIHIVHADVARDGQASERTYAQVGGARPTCVLERCATTPISYRGSTSHYVAGRPTYRPRPRDSPCQRPSVWL
jgi:type IV secretory pathway ATPase VirB11/archaellum biosynthesis ATPase